MRMLLYTMLILLASCGGRVRPALEDLSGRENLSLYRVQEIRGARDGDRLRAEAVLSDSSSVLTMDLQFAIGSPTTLESGSWRWTRARGIAAGAVRARSVTFLGGQSGPPSIGGAFDLVDDAGAARYRATLPTTELKPLRR